MYHVVSTRFFLFGYIIFCYKNAFKVLQNIYSESNEYFTN